ncbi:sensor histidine kinase [Anaeromyxobacter paludicola]|uniref:sensor histidine kinase n=1 Tax=Anaeromyxobacter paludicola TaxID=2918171 RepID=UPI0020C0E777|nr:HAMP domain-containing sensor histidine kinase [Anaeromyxobacter paludicola]
MSARPVRGRQRLAIRIYLVTAAALLAVVLALVAVASALWRPPRHGGPFADVARFTAGELAVRWGSQDAVSAEVGAAAIQLQVAISAWLPDGTLVASTRQPPLPAPTAGEREALGRAELVERGGPCLPDRCQLVFEVPGDDGPAGYLVMESAHPHPQKPPLELLGFALLLVALGVAAALLGRSLARPMERLAQTAHALGAGDLRARTGLARSDELGAVAHAFDDMADRVEQLVRSQTELVANVAHELRTPLARIRVALDLAESGDPAVARESLAEIAQDLSELEQLVTDILAAARLDLSRSSALTGAPPLRRARLEVARVVGEAAERLRQRHPERPLAVEVEPGLPGIDGDGPLLRRAVDNLLDNARKYSRAGAPITLRASRRGSGVAIEVIDSGDGIPPEDLPRLGTPFFRGDKSRARATGGVGLGLSLTRRIAEAHGGSLVPASTLGVGTTMTLLLPAAPEEPAAEAGPLGRPA